MQAGSTHPAGMFPCMVLVLLIDLKINSRYQTILAFINFKFTNMNLYSNNVVCKMLHILKRSFVVEFSVSSRMKLNQAGRGIKPTRQKMRKYIHAQNVENNLLRTETSSGTWKFTQGSSATVVRFVGNVSTVILISRCI